MAIIVIQEGQLQHPECGRSCLKPVSTVIFLLLNLIVDSQFYSHFLFCLPSLKLNFVSFTVLSLFVYPAASSMSEVGCLIGFLKLTFPIRSIMFFSRHQPLYSALFLKENGITMLFQKQSPETLYSSNLSANALP